jgi:hypothetical protein
MMESRDIMELAMQKHVHRQPNRCLPVITRRNSSMRILTFRYPVGSHGGADSHCSLSTCDRIKNESSTFITGSGNDVPEDPVS